MKKSFKMRHFEKIVSVFVFIAIFFVTSMIIFLAKQKKIFAKKIEYYTIINSIEKISTGQEIILKGPNITVGKIDNFTITPSNKVRVDFFIYKDYEDKVRSDSVIVFSSPFLGVLGGYKVELTSGDGYYPKIADGGLVPSNQMNEGTFLLSIRGLDKDKDEIPLLSKIDPLLTNLTALLDPKGRTMRNANELIRHLSIFSLQLSEGGVLNVIGDPSFRSNLRKAMTQVNTLLGTSDNLLNTRVRDILGETFLLLGNLKKTTDSINYNMPKTLSHLNTIMFRLERMIRNMEQSPLLGGGGGYRTGRTQETKRFFEGP